MVLKYKSILFYVSWNHYIFNKLHANICFWKLDSWQKKKKEFYHLLLGLKEVLEFPESPPLTVEENESQIAKTHPKFV